MKNCLALLLMFFLTTSLQAEPAYAELNSLTTQVPSSSGYSLVKIDTVNEMKNIELALSKDKVIIQKKGVYFISGSGQMASLNQSAEGYMDVWLLKNGVAIPNSNYRVSISTRSRTDVVATQILISLVEGDTISVGYSASAPSLGFVFIQPEKEPAMTSFTLTLFKIAD